MYCGDETGAFIGDVGSHTSRFGYGGEDCPKVVVPSAVYRRSYVDDGCSGNGHIIGKKGARGSIYSAPVSTMRAPPDDCFSASGDGEGDGWSLGCVPIYSSVNSNHRKNWSSNADDDGAIDDIDAWASLWEYSYGALCVRGKGKHTTGYKYHPEPDLQSEATQSKSRATSVTKSHIEVTIDHPLLAVDSTIRNASVKSQQKQRAAMLETLFESLSAPATYIAPSPMLSSFAYGKQTSLVIDVGHSGIKVTPVVDGYCLSHGSVSSGRGGAWLGDVQRSVLEGVIKCNGWGRGSGRTGEPPCRNEGIVPRYLLHPTFSSSKYPAKKMQLLKRSSFHSMAIHEVMYEMMTSSHVLSLDRNEVSSAPFCGYEDESDVKMCVDDDVDMEEDPKEDDDDNDEAPFYVLPDGTRVDLAQSKVGRDLCRLPELLFSNTIPYPNNSAGNMLPLQKVVHESLTQLLDADLRKELSSNIILTGGASLFAGLDKRLSVELGEILPSSYKYKVTASKNSVENRYSAWIGGSILSSLGSFQQLWLSKREYEECGAVLGLQRFKD
ncbi:hypothetical protein ACHAXA_002761 [Cyclostephanos tholiformis]|uniref:Actin n=1 Tax=Cyclostephanos tholiformis TaxID=382380 RepID=A0ABD3RF28_9STRA